MTLTEILTYANVLTEDGFDTLADCIDFLNEAQDLIAGWEPIQADPVEYTLTTNLITLPVDFLQMSHATYEDYPYLLTSQPWKGTLELPTSMTSGTLKIWYYKTPAVLLSSTPSQVPEVATKYHRAMASYAAKMYHLIDDDPALREAFRNEFMQSLTAMKTSTGFAANYINF